MRKARKRNMNHQITLEELGLIPKSGEAPEQDKNIRKDYAFPCGGCICNHCANSVGCFERCIGEADFECFTCDECRWIDGKGTIDNRRTSCGSYKVTDAYAKRTRRKFKAVKPESEG